jgi:hypothetical protein
VRLAVPLAVLLAGGCTGSDAEDPRPASEPRTTAPAVAEVLSHAADTTLAVDPKHVISSTVLAGPRARHVQHVDGHVGLQPGTWSTVLVSDGARSEVRVIDRQAWLTTEVQQTRSLFPAGRSWVRMDAERLDAMAVPATWDQLAMVEVLRGAHTIRERGVETVEKVPTRRYTLEVDLERAVCLASPESRDTVRALAQGPDGAPVSMSAEAWVDEFDLVRRLVITVPLDGARTATHELRVPGDNAAAAVQAPPASQVAPLEQAPTLASVIPDAPTASADVSC